MRIGVVPDTHVVDELPRLPSEVPDILDRAGVDLMPLRRPIRPRGLRPEPS